MNYFFYLVGIFFTALLKADWASEYSKAEQLSQELKKPLLIAFVGPAWCPWSEKLISEVLTQPSFIEELGQDLVLLKIDFPENFSHFSSKELECVKLKEKYQIQECPLLFLVDPSGEGMAKIGYLPLEVKEWISYVKELIFDFHFVKMALDRKYLSGSAFEQLKTLYQRAKRLTNPKYQTYLLEVGLKKDQGGYFLMEKYAQTLRSRKERNLAKKLREKILSRDPKNDHGTHRKVALLEFEVLSLRAKKQKNPQEVIKPLLNYIKIFGAQDKENLWKLEMTIAEYLFSKNLILESLDHAKASHEAAPENQKDQIQREMQCFQAGF